jgi:iron complex outermembrane recepter protein
LGRWTRTFSDTANFKLQAYYDYTGLEAPVINEQRHTVDLDFRHEFSLGDRNHLNWGLGYRVTTDREKDNPTISFVPLSETLNLYSAFLQDEIALVEDRLSLTLGSKLEHNDYTGFEVEPSARLLWTPVAHQTFWTAVSRAARTPSRAEETFDLMQSQQYAPGMYAPINIMGTGTYGSEDQIAYEAGYRTDPWKQLSLDLAVFYNDYTHLRSERQDPVNPTEFWVANDISGYTYGFDASATWRVLDWWRIQPTYSLVKMDLHAHAYGPGLEDNASVTQIEGTSPENQFAIRSSMDLPHGLSFDTSLRYVDGLSYFAINSYFELDARLAWQINPHWQVAIVGQNLLHSSHAEFGPTYLGTQNGNITEIPRSVYAQVTWRF